MERCTAETCFLTLDQQTGKTPYLLQSPLLEAGLYLYNTRFTKVDGVPYPRHFLPLTHISLFGEDICQMTQKGHIGEPSPYRDQVGTVQQEGEATHCSFSGPIKLEAARWLESIAKKCNAQRAVR